MIKKRLKYKRRVFVYTLLTALILFSIADYYFETTGLPDLIKDDIRSRFREKGLTLTFDDAKCGVFNGLILSNPRLSGGDARIYPHVSAVSMRIYPRFSLSSHWLVGLKSFIINGGEAVFPLFPESGVEGGGDKLEFHDIDAMLVVDGKALEVAWLTGRLWKLKVSIVGRIDNIFSPKVASWFSTGVQQEKKLFDTSTLISSYSYQARALLWREYKDFSAKVRWEAETPECNMSFKLNPLNSKANKLNLDLRVPPLGYASYNIDGAKATITLIGDKLSIDQCEIRSPAGDALTINGILDTAKVTATGRIQALLSSETFLALSENKQIEVPPDLKLRSGVDLSLSFKDHPIHSITGDFGFKLNIKKLRYKSAEIEDLRLAGKIGDDSISIPDGKLSVDGVNLKLSMSCKPSTKSLDLDAHCFGPPSFVPKLISGPSARLIKDIIGRFTFPKENKDVDLTVQAHVSWDGKLFYMATGNAVMRDFKYYKTKFASGDSAYILDSNGLIFFHNMYLYQKNGWTKAALMYIYTPGFEYHVESPDFKSRNGPRDEFATDFEGIMTGEDLLNCIFPKWHSDMLDLSEPADLKANGVIDFRNMDETRFNVSVKKSACGWNSVPITDLSYDLRVKSLDMVIKNVKGKVYGGDLALDYATNFKTSKGRVDLKLNDAAFPPLARTIGWKLSNDKGRISLTADANLAKDDSGKMTLVGKGNVIVKDADLWGVPVLRYFGEMASKWTGGKWGVISDLTADFKFEKDHVSTENIHTNGNVVALSGKGKYYWRTKNYDFIIHGEIFKSAMPYKFLSKFLQPLSSLMSRRIVRENGKTTLEKVKKKR